MECPAVHRPPAKDLSPLRIRLLQSTPTWDIYDLFTTTSGLKVVCFDMQRRGASPSAMMLPGTQLSPSAIGSLVRDLGPLRGAD